jgi:hypothetical protein
MVGVGCPGVNRADEECTVYGAGIDVRMERGHCEYMNIHAPKVGVNLPKGAKKKINPIKQSKKRG